MKLSTGFLLSATLGVGLLVTGCVSMPKETALLTAHMGRQIAESKRSHEALIEDWAYQRREKAEVLFRYHIIREFIIRFLKKPIVKKDLDKVVCSDKGEYDRAIVMQDIVQAVSDWVEGQRKTAFDEIETQRQALLNALIAHYAELDRMHRAIAANVRSVVKGKEFEKELRNALTQKLDEVVPIRKATEKMDDLLEKLSTPEEAQ